MKMSVVRGSRLLCIFAVICCHWLAGDTRADRFTNGFPNVLVTQISIDMSSHYTLRLIPDMSFTCNGTIVGFTVAGMIMRQGMQSNSPIIQIWRPQNISQLSYYNTDNEIAIGSSVCTEFSQSNRIWQCNLTDTNRVQVQAGDVLDLLLPPRMDTSFNLSVAEISSTGPINYVFESQELISDPTVNLYDAMFENNQLPQIAVDIVPDVENDCSKCVTGFTDRPAFQVGQRTGPWPGGNNVLTILIPDMNFTYNATIAGFIVAGTNFRNSKIQIWRQNCSQPGTYYKAQSDIIVNGASGCVSWVTIAMGIHFCILKSMAVSVQPGDFLGLEIPRTNENSGIYFTSGGPENYVFTGALNSPVELANNSAVVQQRPQIAFNLTSDQCTSGFLYEVIKTTGERLESINMTTTVLLPNLMFGCSGTIVRLTIAVAHNYDSGQPDQQATKVQIWKATQNLYKSGPEILVSNSSCVGMTLIEGILQCTLSEAARVSVQPGDILGVEIPPIAADHNGYEILFDASSESMAYIFRQCQPSSTVILSEADDITSHLPQIIPLVILDTKTPPSVPPFTSASTPPSTTCTTIALTPPSPSQPGTDTGQLVGVVVGALVAALSLVLIVILAIFLILFLTRRGSQNLYDVPVPPQSQTDIDSTIYSQIIDSQGMEMKNNEAYSPSTTQQIPTEDNVVYDQITPQVPTGDNIAYDQAAASQLQITTEDNVAYYGPQISTVDNAAYGQVTSQIPTEDNVAYGQATASQQHISTEDNVVYGHGEDDYATISDPIKHNYDTM